MKARHSLINSELFNQFPRPRACPHHYYNGPNALKSFLGGIRRGDAQSLFIEFRPQGRNSLPRFPSCPGVDADGVPPLWVRHREVLDGSSPRQKETPSTAGRI